MRFTFGGRADEAIMLASAQESRRATLARPARITPTLTRIDLSVEIWSVESWDDSSVGCSSRFEGEGCEVKTE